MSEETNEMRGENPQFQTRRKDANPNNEIDRFNITLTIGCALSSIIKSMLLLNIALTSTKLNARRKLGMLSNLGVQLSAQ